MYFSIPNRLLPEIFAANNQISEAPIIVAWAKNPFLEPVPRSDRTSRLDTDPFSELRIKLSSQNNSFNEANVAER